MAISNPGLNWEKTEIILGEIKKGEAVEMEFNFTNDTGEPIKILNAKGSCGCTDISFEENLIAPGKSTSIRAKFRSDKNGTFNKTVTVITSNTTEPTTLKFQGTIID